MSGLGLILTCYLPRPAVDDEQMVDYLSALLSICFMIFLGFTDDVLDLPWRWVSFASNRGGACCASAGAEAQQESEGAS